MQGDGAVERGLHALVAGCILLAVGALVLLVLLLLNLVDDRDRDKGEGDRMSLPNAADRPGSLYTPTRF